MPENVVVVGEELDSKLSDVLLQCEEYNISNIELGSNHAYEQDFEKIVGKHAFQYLKAVFAH